MSIEDRLTIDERRKYLRKMQECCLRAARKERGQLLDEMEAIAELHRKSLITPPYPTEQIPVPAQYNLGLHNHQCLLPSSQSAGQQDEESSISPGQLRAPDLVPQYDRLVAQEHVLQHQFRLTARQIHSGIQDWIMIAELCPPAETLFGCLIDRFDTLAHKEKP